MEILLLIILNPYFLIPATLTGTLPLRWVLRFWIFILLVFFGFLAFETQESVLNDHGGMHLLGIGLLIINAILLSIIVVARLVIQNISKKKSETHPFEAKALNRADFFLFLATGIVSSLFIFKFLAFSLGGFPHGFLIHGGLSLILIGAVGAVLRLALNNKKYSHFKILTFAFAVSSGLFILSALGTFYPYVVTQSAKNIARENSYCISLNSRTHPLNSLEDLTLLTMDKVEWGHHAILLVEKEDATLEPYHWSYFQSAFLPGILNWENDNKPSIPCRPARDFIKKIPLISATETQDTEFYFHDNFLKIPKGYSPYVSSKYLSLAVQAPDFKPVEREKGRLYPSMEVGSREWMENLHKNYESLPPTGKIGNLNEIKNAENGINWYYRFNEGGQLVTVAGCYSSGRNPEIACQHRFYRNGAMYTFDHSVELLSQSDEMEKNLFDLLEGFKEK